MPPRCPPVKEAGSVREQHAGTCRVRCRHRQHQRQGRRHLHSLRASPRASGPNHATRFPGLAIEGMVLFDIVEQLVVEVCADAAISSTLSAPWVSARTACSWMPTSVRSRPRWLGSTSDARGYSAFCAHSSPTTRRSTSPVTLLAPSSVGCGASATGFRGSAEMGRDCRPARRAVDRSYLSQRHPRLTNRCVAGQQPSMGTRSRRAVARVRRAAAGGDVGRRHRRRGDVAVPAVGRLDRRRRDRCRRRT